jgi:hypothetical protein
VTCTTLIDITSDDKVVVLLEAPQLTIPRASKDAATAPDSNPPLWDLEPPAGCKHGAMLATNSNRLWLPAP